MGRKSGQVMVEFALLFPFFLLVVLGGIIDFGIAFHNLITLQDIVGEASRYAAEGNQGKEISDQQVLDFVHSRKPEWWKGDFIVTPVQVIVSSDKQAEFKKVQVIYETPMITPFYLTMFEAVSGKKTLRLVAHAAFQIPRNLP
jgi:hypothetical protein